MDRGLWTVDHPVGHNLKIQTDVSFIEEENKDDVLMYRLQMEVAF